MTVAIETTRQLHNGDGVTTVLGFPSGWDVQNKAHIRVIQQTSTARTILTEGVDYTVSLTNSQITMTVAPAIGTTITIRIYPVLKQEGALRDRVEIDLGSHEDLHDARQRQILRHEDDISRAIRLPESEAGSLAATELPIAATRAGGYLGFDASGNVAILASAPSGGLLVLEAANVIAQRNGVNPQTWRLYNTYTSASNYERFSAEWTGNTCFLRTEQAGAGSARQLYVGTTGSADVTLISNNTPRWVIVGASGHLVASTDNVSDIGASGATRPRTIYPGTSIVFPTGGLLSWSTDLHLQRDAANVIAQRNTTNAQAMRVYNTFTDASNYERGVLAWIANQFNVGTQNAGTGGNRAMNLTAGGVIDISPGGTSRYEFANTAFITFADNTYDIGVSGSNRFRTLYLATSAISPLYTGITDNTATLGTSALRFALGHIQLIERRAAASDANPSMSLGASLQLGLGGATALDWTLARNGMGGAPGTLLTLNGTLGSSPAEYHAFEIAPTIAGAFTVTRFNYLRLDDAAGAATVTDAAALAFNAAVGTHKALAANAAVAVTIGAGPTGSTAGNPQGWIKINVNGTLRYVPFW